MMNVLPDWPLLLAFVGASVLLAVTPGPGVFYIIARSLAQGRRSGLASVAGVALGNLGNALGASLGLAALFAVSAVAFTVVKYAGALYLIYLGIQALRAPASNPDEAVIVKTPITKVFRDGFVVALLNPKTAIFFAAFLPQFMSPDANAIAQSAVLGAIFVAIAAVTDTLYAVAAGSVAPVLARAGRAGGSLQVAGRWLSAGAFIGLGIWTALSGNRARQ